MNAPPATITTEVNKNGLSQTSLASIIDQARTLLGDQSSLETSPQNGWVLKIGHRENEGGTIVIEALKGPENARTHFTVLDSPEGVQADTGRYIASNVEHYELKAHDQTDQVAFCLDGTIDLSHDESFVEGPANSGREKSPLTQLDNVVRHGVISAMVRRLLRLRTLMSNISELAEPSLSMSL